jgi:hypothetical protein
VNGLVACSSTNTGAPPDLILNCTNCGHSAVKVRAQLKQTPIDSPVVQSSQLRSADIVTRFAH